MPKKIWVPVAVVTFMILVLVSGVFAYKLVIPRMPGLLNAVFDRSLSFSPKSSTSSDGQYELKQSSKEDKDNVNSLYFEITKAGDKTPLFKRDCEFRLYDFKYLGWGVGTDDVWAVSGDLGVFCYVYNGDGTWAERLVGSDIKSTDDVWKLDMMYGDGSISASPDKVERATVPKEVIDFLH